MSFDIEYHLKNILNIESEEIRFKARKTVKQFV